MTTHSITFPQENPSTDPPGGIASPPLDRPLQFLRGVGPVKARRLEKLGLRTVKDLLFHFPRSYEDRRFLPSARWGAPGTPVAFQGTAGEFVVKPAGPQLVVGRTLLSGAQAPGAEALWFRRRSFRYDPFHALRRRIGPGVRLAVYGPWQPGARGPEIRVEDHELEALPGPGMDRWVPVYPLTEGLDARLLRALLWSVRGSASFCPDPLPVELARDLGPLDDALRDIHFPPDLAAAERARRRIAFEEFFFLELALVLARRAPTPPAPACRPTRELLTPFRSALGFDFTPAQKRVINEIFGDMAGTRPMNRLLMGDVGSGKTVVALSALLLAVENGLQGAFLAPTEILAEQHAAVLAQRWRGLPVRWAVWTGGRSPAEKRRQNRALASGEIQVALGTHALLQGTVAFKDLGAVVIDEQHRFGVRQRAALRAKARSPHVLVMTATPIPRTLALTAYGDLDVSTISERPPGRRETLTRRGSEREALEAVRRALGSGRQAFVVYPWVEETGRRDSLAVRAGWRRLQAAFPGHPVGLLHGRLSSGQKEAAMGAFLRGETRILASTPVIEVGIDVPNASVLAVMSAERFGLAQLHQLRGRVGRGPWPSECWLVPGAESAEADERLEVLCRESDGFRLAEEDLSRRGPGEVLGDVQHGLPDLRAGRLAADADLISRARRAALEIVGRDPALADPRHASLGPEVRRRFEGRLGLGRVG